MTHVDKTAVCLLVDKEEVGSQGATGMQSHFFVNALAEVMNALGDYSELKVRRRCRAPACSAAMSQLPSIRIMPA